MKFEHSDIAFQAKKIYMLSIIQIGLTLCIRRSELFSVFKYDCLPL